MSLFSKIEESIERGFRKWTERMFGPADSGELLLVHRAILESIESRVQTVARGKRVFPYGHVTVTLVSADPDRRALYQTAFGEGGRLEYDFTVAPQADPGSIRLEFSGQCRLYLDAGGDLIISTGAGDIRWKRPEIYQNVNGRRRPVGGRFIVSRNRVRFEVAVYDHSR